MRVTSTEVNDLVGLLRGHARKNPDALRQKLPGLRPTDIMGMATAIEECVRRGIASGVIGSPSLVTDKLRRGDDPSPLLHFLLSNALEHRARELDDEVSAGRPRVFEFLSDPPSGSMATLKRPRVILTETPPVGWIATVRDLDDRTYRVALEPVGADLRGSFERADGSIASVAVNAKHAVVWLRTHQGCVCQPAALDRDLFTARVNEQTRQLFASRIDLASANSPPQTAPALALVKQLTVQSHEAALVVLDQLRLHPEAASRDAAALPLLYAIATNGDRSIPAETRGRALRDNVQRILDDPGLPELPRRLLERSVRAYESTEEEGDGPGYRILCVGVHAAIAAITDREIPEAGKGPREFELYLKGARVAFSRLVDEETGANRRYHQLTGAWRMVFAMLRETLDADHPAAKHLAKALDEGAALKPQKQARHLVLALGSACYFIDHGKFPKHAADEPGRSPMPELAVRSLVGPVHVLEALGPLGETDATWRDVEQGMLGNCYFGGGCGAVAMARPRDIATLISSFMVRASGELEEFRQFCVRYSGYVVKEGKPDEMQLVSHEVWLDGRLYVERDGSAVYGHAHGAGKLEHKRSWYAFVEKAFAMLRKRNARYGSTEGGTPAEMFRLLYPNASVGVVRLDGMAAPSEVITSLQTALRGSLPIACATHTDESRYATSKLRDQHVYMISGIEQTSAGVQVHLVNLNRPRPPRPDNIAAHVLQAVFNSEDLSIKAFGELTVPLEEFIRDMSYYTFVALPPEETPESRARVRGF